MKPALFTKREPGIEHSGLLGDGSSSLNQSWENRSLYCHNPLCARLSNFMQSSCIAIRYDPLRNSNISVMLTDPMRNATFNRFVNQPAIRNLNIAKPCRIKTETLKEELAPNVPAVNAVPVLYIKVSW